MNAKLIETMAANHTNSRHPRLNCSPENLAILSGPPSSVRGRRPASPRSQEWAFRTGIAFVLALMLFVTINDVASLSLFDG